MFEMSDEELENWRSQIVTSSWGGTRYTPMAFTEQGVAMLSSVLRSKRAVGIKDETDKFAIVKTKPIFASRCG